MNRSPLCWLFVLLTFQSLKGKHTIGADCLNPNAKQTTDRNTLQQSHTSAKPQTKQRTKDIYSYEELITNSLIMFEIKKTYNIKVVRKDKMNILLKGIWKTSTMEGEFE